MLKIAKHKNRTLNERTTNNAYNKKSKNSA